MAFTCLSFCLQPAHLAYSSGQYLRLSSDFIKRGETHPISVSSAPHHPNLSVHVLSVGPWTTRLFQLYHPTHLQRRPLAGASTATAAAPNSSFMQKQASLGSHSSSSPGNSSTPPLSSDGSNGSTGSASQFSTWEPAGFVAKSSEFYLPPINVDGPFGGGHQGWSKFRTVVLIGGGIGITPFASILQDFMHQVQVERLQEKEKERRHKKKMQQKEAASAKERGAGASTATPFSSASSPELTKKSLSGQRVPVNGHAELSTHASSSSASSSSKASKAPLMLYLVWIGQSLSIQCSAHARSCTQRMKHRKRGLSSACFGWPVALFCLTPCLCRPLTHGVRVVD